YRYALDWDAWVRIARAYPVAWLARTTVAVRWHEASETHRFKSGTDDMDEQVRLLKALHDSDPARFGRKTRRAADRRLARAFLNRAYDAARAGDAVLTRKSLRRAIALRPALVAGHLADPRLAWRIGRSLLRPAP